MPCRATLANKHLDVPVQATPKGLLAASGRRRAPTADPQQSSTRVAKHPLRAAKTPLRDLLGIDRVCEAGR